MVKHKTDIIYLNIRENMNGVKLQLGLSMHPGILILTMIQKQTQTHSISILSLLRFIDRDLPPRNQRSKVYGGHLNEYDECGGSGELCEKLRAKLYMSGHFYWLSAELA